MAAKERRGCPGTSPPPARPAGTHRNTVFTQLSPDRHTQCAQERKQQPHLFTALANQDEGPLTAIYMCIRTRWIPAAAVQPNHSVCSVALHGSQSTQLQSPVHTSPQGHIPSAEPSCMHQHAPLSLTQTPWSPQQLP